MVEPIDEAVARLIVPRPAPRGEPEETAEWVEALRQVLRESPERAGELVRSLFGELRTASLGRSILVSDYVNTIPRASEPPYPGDEALEERILNINRWNAAAMVVRAEAAFGGLGGHLSTYASTSIMREVLRAQTLLAERGVAADVWSATSYHQLRLDALACEREQRLTGRGPEPYVMTCLATVDAPVVAASDSMKAVPDLIARWVPNEFVSLGTDGFGLSDTREALRRRFEVDAEHVAVAALAALHRSGTVPRSAVDDAIEAYEISEEGRS